ncbi:serine/threonine-protein phosphatase 4 catalytic subunit B-like [Colius striatus]|uniref:serine/threonine-protein phosphatase 4 catalytic subunit B-like n=1 Tax=Colius striatus TaxID=57412 RepID=UPI002B1E6CE2|nr:serine/threonine-protein phosphatase 4 catalytic subunit B-like [Colius striatus]
MPQKATEFHVSMVPLGPRTCHRRPQSSTFPWCLWGPGHATEGHRVPRFHGVFGAYWRLLVATGGCSWLLVATGGCWRLLEAAGGRWWPVEAGGGRWRPADGAVPADTTGWGVSPRGAGYLFGSDVVAQFNASNDIDMICRAHQLVMEGYKWHFNETVLTIWSAPNYCYRCGNVAAILELDEHLQKEFIIFEAAPQETRGIPSKKPVADYFL